MTRRRSLSEDERALWSGVARLITPLQRQRRPSAPSTEDDGIETNAKSKPEPASPPAVRHKDMPPAKRAPPLAPLGRRLKQRVARGREQIDARLDLHGYTQTEAHAALLRFLRRAQAADAKIVLVVTGKGSARSEDGAGGERGVLKRMVPMWLSLPEFRFAVVGFEEAHIGHGGEGALYVRLRRPR
jgi:DNA-nicking Smr family endonuclease